MARRLLTACCLLAALAAAAAADTAVAAAAAGTTATSAAAGTAATAATASTGAAAAAAGTAAAAADTAGCKNPPRVINGAWDVSSAADGVTITASCKKGYTSTAPQTTCRAGTWTPLTSSECKRVCAGMPPASLLGGLGSWTCAADSVPVFSRCAARCNDGTFGKASIMCVGGAWSVMVGRCSTKPVCNSLPPPLLNSQWPAECIGTEEGAPCRTVCNSAYREHPSGNPFSVCLPGGTGWSAPSHACVRNGTAAAAAARAAARLPAAHSPVPATQPPKGPAAQQPAPVKPAAPPSPKPAPVPAAAAKPAAPPSPAPKKP